MASYNNGNGQSLSDLEQQAETTRAELAQTVEELQSRVSSSALKREARDYARSTGQQILQNLEIRARENPMAAVAVAAGLAVPLWRMISNIPAPLLLIGAGVAMAQRGSGTSTARHGWQPAQAGTFAEDIKSRASELSSNVSDKVSEMGTQVKDTVSDTAERARSLAEDATLRTGETVLEASKQARHAFDRGRNTMVDLIERHPFAAGGAALLAGGLIASALPTTRRENRLMGEASEALRHRGQVLAEQGLDAATETATDIYESSAPLVSEQGLTPDAARSTVREVMDKAGNAIEKAAAGIEGSRPRTGKTRRS